ncbi:carboxymuconolactone decarboxylase family protein [Methanospirillum lacunae]|uniref:4-carboxymuconolactone decarboxylase n=1 Tax=Methanospirillum lacunae TaxID=668570 RepID=A0A2V2MVC9_9EURY|nr:carboxymuconolactone decarboxylase family protein [Methanospirillum lacunae]PWR72114.1 4-carboxymuconolactone decarboxylase [Methanospirillum lacunae]
MEQKQVETGFKKLSEIDGRAGEEVYERLQKISPFMADYLLGSFGEICSITDIDNKTREVAVIGACTALGYAIPQLKVHIHAGLNVGLTKEEILAIINTMSAYAGFPATLNALYAAEEVFKDEGI